MKLGAALHQSFFPVRVFRLLGTRAATLSLTGDAKDAGVTTAAAEAAAAEAAPARVRLAPLALLRGGLGTGGAAGMHVTCKWSGRREGRQVSRRVWGVGEGGCKALSGSWWRAGKEVTSTEDRKAWGLTMWNSRKKGTVQSSGRCLQPEGAQSSRSKAKGGGSGSLPTVSFQERNTEATMH